MRHDLYNPKSYYLDNEINITAEELVLFCQLLELLEGVKDISNTWNFTPNGTRCYVCGWGSGVKASRGHPYIKHVNTCWRQYLDNFYKRPDKDSILLMLELQRENAV